MNSTQRWAVGGEPEASRASSSQPDVALVGRARRPAIVGDGFRAISGALLVVHFGQQVRVAPFTLSAWQSMAEPAVRLPIASALLLGLGVSALRAWFALAMLLAWFIAIGIAPRLCAVLLVFISAATYCALAPMVTPDDYVAECLPFWLALLPVGGTVALPLARDWRSWMTRRVEGRAATGCAIFLFLVLANIVFRCDPVPPMAPLGIFATASLAITPVEFVRRLAGLPAMATLWSLRHLDGASLMIVALVATCVLWAGTAGASPTVDPEPRSHVRFGTANAIGATAVFLIAAQTAAAALRIPTVARSAGAVLAQAGLPWSWEAPLNPEPIGRLEVAFADGDGNVAPAEGVDADNVQVQRMLRFLQMSTGDGAQRLPRIRALVMKHCGEDSAPWLRRGVVILRGNGVARRVARFDCALEGDLADVVLLNDRIGSSAP
jgi:hypothetical protein